MHRTRRTVATAFLFTALTTVGVVSPVEPANAHGSCTFTATHVIGWTGDDLRGDGWIMCSSVHDVYSMTVCIEFRASLLFDWNKLGCSSYNTTNENDDTYVQMHVEPCFEPGFYRTWMDGSAGTNHTTPPVTSGDSGTFHLCALK